MTGKELRKESKQVLMEVLMGILIYMLAGLVVILFLPLKTAPIAIGFFLGCLLSAGSMIHITYVTELRWTCTIKNQQKNILSADIL